MAGQDPFARPKPISSAFASAQSFRGRLVLIEPTSIELDVPGLDDPTKRTDRLTATVTTVDGQGPVQAYSRKEATGKWLEGPEHRGVWFSQDRIRDGVIGEGNRHITPGTRILARIETYKPGKGAGVGNPWGLIDPTDEDVKTATAFLASRTIGQATAPAAVSAPAEDKNPFGDDAPF